MDELPCGPPMLQANESGQVACELCSPTGSKLSCTQLELSQNCLGACLHKSATTACGGWISLGRRMAFGKPLFLGHRHSSPTIFT